MDATSRRATRQCCATHPRVNTTQLLLRSYLFAELSPADLTSAAAGSRLRHYEAGEPVFLMGDPASELMVIADGQCKYRVLDAYGHEMIAELLTAGQTFGEPGLFAPERDRITDAVAMQRSHVVHVPRAELLAIINRHPPVAVRLIESLARNARWMARKLVQAMHLRVRDRLVAVFQDLASIHGVPDAKGLRLSVALNHTVLAAMVGATRENVARAMGELTAGSTVIVDHGTYYLDLAALARLASVEPPPTPRDRPTRAG